MTKREVDPEFPYSFSRSLASPDMAVHLVGAETPLQKFIRETAAEDNVAPDNPAFGMISRAIESALEEFGAEILPKDSN